MKKKQNAIVVAKTVKNVQREKPDEMLAAVCEFFGIDPDRDKLAYEIFTEIIVARKENKGVKTIDVTKKAHVTQAAVVYHMNTFMRNGLIIKQGREYVLRGENLDQTFDELEQDMVRRMRRMRELARILDESALE